MADKYPSMSPYAYCAWNPVKLIDPMGDSLKLVGTDDCKKAALSQMKSKTNNLTFSYSDDGTVNVMNLHEVARTNAGDLACCIGKPKKEISRLYLRE